MDPRLYDPPEKIEYVFLLTQVFRAFRAVTSHEMFLAQLGPQKLTDVTDLPEFQEMKTADPLPPDFSERLYQFREPSLRRGVVEAAIGYGQLVNVRAQLFFSGWRAKGKAKRYYGETLAPTFRELLGRASDEGPHFCTFHPGRLVVHARHVPGLPSVSAHLTDESHH